MNPTFKKIAWLAMGIVGKKICEELGDYLAKQIIQKIKENERIKFKNKAAEK